MPRSLSARFARQGLLDAICDRTVAHRDRGPDAQPVDDTGHGRDSGGELERAFCRYVADLAGECRDAVAEVDFDAVAAQIDTRLVLERRPQTLRDFCGIYGDSFRIRSECKRRAARGLFVLELTHVELRAHWTGSRDE
jgi:hypothetical protein